MQEHHRENQHVGEVKRLAGEEDDVFAQGMAGAPEVIVLGKEEALEIAHEDVIEREHRVEEQAVDVLEAVPPGAGLVGGEAEDAAAGEGVVFAVEVDAGVVAAVVQDAPHVGVDAAEVEGIVEGLVDQRRGGDCVVIAVVGDIQQEKCLGEASQEVERDERPGARVEGIDGDPAAE